MGMRPTAPAVARRALCTGAVFTRGFIERNLQMEGQDLAAWRPHAARITGWLSESDLLPGETSGAETLLLAQPLGRWAAEEVTGVSWWSEAIGVLLWSLRRLDTLPRHDELVDASGFEAMLPLLGDLGEFVGQARLRPEAEIDRQRAAAELWRWRSRNEGEQSADSIVGRAAAAAYEDGLIPAPVSGDFPAFGRPYRDLGRSERDVAASIAAERFLTLNWLCGETGSWDEARAGA